MIYSKFMNIYLSHVFSLSVSEMDIVTQHQDTNIFTKYTDSMSDTFTPLYISSETIQKSRDST